jgi:tripartite-type tricarboxylate transporter receptor subunit TctC
MMSAITVAFPESAMKLARRKFLHLAAGAVALPPVSRVAMAQSYPTRPITMIIQGAGAAGDLADTLGRILAERMRQSLKQPIIVDNVGGADGSIAAGRSARAIFRLHSLDLCWSRRTMGVAGPAI